MSVDAVGPAAQCPRCGRPNLCGMAAGATTCWCMAAPLRLPVPAAASDASCYCAACLDDIRKNAPPPG